jgi:hypothetical protein
MSDTGLSGKMSVLAALLAVMEEQGDKVKNVWILLFPTRPLSFK